jgi:hypothetical protein
MVEKVYPLTIKENEILINRTSVLNISSFITNYNTNDIISLINNVMSFNDALFNWEIENRKRHITEELLAYSCLRYYPNTNLKFLRNFKKISSSYIKNLIPLRKISLYLIILIIRIKKIIFQTDYIHIYSTHINNIILNSTESIVMESFKLDFATIYKWCKYD